MCGIAGIFAYHYAASRVDRQELGLIRDHMRARGPDGSGEWFSADQKVGLGHRRLAIIDLSDSGHQPMVSADGTVVISFNGEIYNYNALRAELELEGCMFRSQSDTEVLLQLYIMRGENMFSSLRGMFAFAIWDARKNAMLLARDPYGIKPLYYADDGWTCRVASQVKALLAGGKVSNDPEPAGIVGFYLFGHVPEPFTLYQEIRSVPAGSYLWINELGTRAPQRYFCIAQVWADATDPRHSRAGGDPALSHLSLGEVEISAGEGSREQCNTQEAVRAALLDSLRHHLIADVPVGAFLSAGIDSGALVGLMRDAGQQDIQTITIAFDEFAGSAEDEAPLAAQTAHNYGANHYTRRVTAKEFHEDLPKILAAMDQPTIDGINTWFIAKATAELGLKVAISGLGGDELFGGYPSFKNIPRSVRLLAVLACIPGIGKAFQLLAAAARTFRPGINPKNLGLLKYGGSYRGAYFLQRGLFMPWELKPLLAPELLKRGLQRLQAMKLLGATLCPKPSSPFARVATLEASLYMRNQLLRDADWASMAHSVELRVPLVDAHLLQTLAPLLSKTTGGIPKEMLANAPVKPLPESILNRRKTGFTTPIHRWMSQPHGQPEMFIANTSKGIGVHWSRSWAQRVMTTDAEA